MTSHSQLLFSEVQHFFLKTGMGWAVLPFYHLAILHLPCTLKCSIIYLGSKALIVAGNTAIRDIIPNLMKKSVGSFLVEAFGGEFTLCVVDRISGIARAGRCDVIVALGGEK